MSKKKSKSSVKNVSKPAKKAAAKPSKTTKKPAKKLNKVAKVKPVPKKLVKAKPAKTKKPLAKKPSKPVKKVVAKKAKKIAKPVKKAVAKKVVASRASATKIKKVVKKISRPGVAAKKAVVKKIAKKVAPKKVVKAVKKPVVKTPVSKVKAVVKSSSKPVAKAVEVKAAAPKPVGVKQQVQETPKPQVVAKPTASSQEQIIKVLAGNSNDKTHAEPAGKFELEYVIHSSASILFEFLTSPSGLSEWFCDDVNIRNENCTFVWDGAEQHAKLVKFVEEKLVRFQWLDKNDGSYFEFRIERDDLTNDISLMVTDFAETPEERESSKLLWDSQIEKLMKVLGSY